MIEGGSARARERERERERERRERGEREEREERESGCGGPASDVQHVPSESIRVHPSPRFVTAT